MRFFVRMLYAGIAIILVLASGRAWGASMEKPSDEGLFTVTLKMTAQHPAVGDNPFTLTIRDARSGAGVEKAAIEVIPWMTMHGHGSSKKAAVRETGGGLYTVHNVYFTMPGTWDLMVNINKKGKKDSLTFTLKNVTN